MIGVVLAFAGIFVAMFYWSEGAIAASEAFVLAVIFGGLSIGLFAARTVSQFLMAFIPLAGAIGYGIYTWRVGSWRQYYKRRRVELIEAIRRDPKNLAAREFLSDVLYNLGDLDNAISEIQAAADMGAGTECRYKLGKWSRERYLRDTTNPICRWCETENQRGARKCSKCGADLPYDTAFTRWLMGGRSSAARCYLLALFAVAVVVVSLLLLPVRFAFLPIIFCIFALSGWALVSSARS